MSQTLRKERETYDRLKAGWLAEGREGQYALICGDEVLGFYGSVNEAVEAGYNAWGIERTFMIRQVCVVEPVYRVNRPCVSVNQREE
jgi:hypothetical protein